MFDQFVEWEKNRHDYAREWKARTGGKVLGYFCTYVPEEIPYAAGVLPHHYTELVIRRLQLRDTSLRDFLDVFHHRALSFFYRAWKKYRPPLGSTALTLSLKLNNVSDEEIRLSTSFLRDVAPEAGRSLEAGIRFDF